MIDDLPEFVYVARYSPLCGCTRACFVAYVALAAVVAVLLSINVHMCGLDAATHTLRMRNVTYPTGYRGITTHDKTTFPTYMQGVTDELRRLEFAVDGERFDITHFNGSAISGEYLVKFNSSVDISFGNFPLALVLNFTLQGQNEIRQLVFSTKEATDIADNGASFDVVLTNPKRKRITTPSPWFNRDYWNNTKLRLNYVDDNNNSGHLSICSGSMHLENGSVWRVANSSSPLTQLPLWFVDMSSIVQAPQAICTADYDVDVLLHPYFCFSPLLVR